LNLASNASSSGSKSAIAGFISHDEAVTALRNANSCGIGCESRGDTGSADSS
jgi:hypothetical protein